MPVDAADDVAKWTDRNEVSAADGAEDLVDGSARRNRAVEDVELSLESLRNVVTSASRVDHGADHLYVHDVGELARLLQVVETFHLHQLTRQLVRHLTSTTIINYILFYRPFYSAQLCKRCTSYGNSVCLSVCLSVTRRYCVKTTARSTVHFALSDSKMCLVL